MNVAQLAIGELLKRMEETLSNVNFLLDSTHLFLANEKVNLSNEILSLGGRIKKWHDSEGTFFLDFHGRKFEAGVIKYLDGVTYCLISFGEDRNDEHIISISKKEVNEVEYEKVPTQIRDALRRHAFDEILLALPK